MTRTTLIAALLLAVAAPVACAQTAARTISEAGDAGPRDAVGPGDAGAGCSTAGCACGRGQACVDGACREARPALRWVRTFSSSYGAALGVAVGDEGSVAAGGYVRGMADLGDGPFTTGMEIDAVAVRYDADGRARWSRRFPGDFAQVRSVAIDPRGVWVNGTFGNFASVGGRTFRSARAPDSFVAHLDPGGTVGAAWQLSGGGDEQAVSVAALGGGEAVTVGYYSGAGQLGASPLRPPGSPAGFAARLSATGAVAWTRSFGAANASLRGVTRTPGGLAVVGIFSGAIELGAGLISAGRFDTFVASVTDAGEVRWAMSYGGAGDDLAEGIASDARGDLYVVSGSTGGLTVGGVPREGAAGLLVALDAGGGVRWSRGLGARAPVDTHVVAVDAAGNAVVAATFQDAAVPEGFDAFVSQGGRDVYWVIYDREAGAVAGRSFGGPDDDTVAAIAAGPCGGFALAGAFQRTADFGGATATTLRLDAFVASWGE